MRQKFQFKLLAIMSNHRPTGYYRYRRVLTLSFLFFYFIFKRQLTVGLEL